MICDLCAEAADLTKQPEDLGGTRISHPVWGHLRCADRNADREPGQLPDCTCQHANVPAGATPRS